MQRNAASPDFQRNSAGSVPGDTGQTGSAHDIPVISLQEPSVDHQPVTPSESPTSSRNVTAFQNLILGSIEEELACSWTFLGQLDAKALRHGLKIARRATSGKRDVLCSRFLLHLHCELRKGVFPVSALTSFRFDGLEVFLDKLVRDVWKPAPSVQELLNVLPGDGREESQFRFELEMEVRRSPARVKSSKHPSRGLQVRPTLPTQPQQRPGNRPSEKKARETSAKLPDFTLNEFARFMLLLRDDDETKEYIYKLTRSLSREQQDVGTRREDFWVSIAERYNDPSFVPNYEFDEPLEAVDPSSMPLVYRTGKKLAEVLRQNRSIWTKVMSRYTASGNNGEVPFLEFCHRNPSTKRLSAVGSRTYITFLVFGLENGCVDEVISSFLSKEMPHGQGLTMGINRDVGDSSGMKRRVSDSDYTGSTSKRGKRSREKEDVSNYLRNIDTSMRKFADIDEKRLSWDQERELKRNRRREHRSAHDSSTRNSEVTSDIASGTSLNEAAKMLTNAYEALENAKKAGASETVIQRLQKTFEMVCSYQEDVFTKLTVKKTSTPKEGSPEQ